MASSPCARRRCAIADCAAGIFYQFVRGISQDLRRGPKSTSSAGAHRKRAAAGNKKREVGVHWGAAIAGPPRGAGVRARDAFWSLFQRDGPSSAGGARCRPRAAEALGGGWAVLVCSCVCRKRDIQSIRRGKALASGEKARSIKTLASRPASSKITRKPCYTRTPGTLALSRARPQSTVDA